MAKFILEIDLGNDAMCLSSDISKALLYVSQRIPVMHDGILKMDRQTIRDEYGNTVGFYEVP